MCATAGMTLRDYFAAKAPIDYELAKRIFGADMPHDDQGRASFLAV